MSKFIARQMAMRDYLKKFEHYYTEKKIFENLFLGRKYYTSR